MSSTEPLPLRIDVARDADPVSGRVSTGDGPDHTFTGWTELFAALQDAISADQATQGWASINPEVDRP